MKRKIAALTIALALCLMTNALALPVTFVGSAPQFAALTLDGADITLQPSDVHVLALRDDGSVLIFADGQFAVVDEATFAALFPDIDAATLPGEASVTPLQQGSAGNGVLALQQQLIELNHLAGTPDGSYGGVTATAISNLQRELGLEETGAADAPMLLLIASLLQEGVTSQPTEIAAPVLEPVGNLTEEDMAAISEAGLMVEYDDIAGTGLITGDRGIVVNASGSADIDEYIFTVRIGLAMTDEADGATFAPALLLDCQCVRRPLMSDVTIKSGDNRFTYEAASLTSEISGAKSIEHAVFDLDDDAATLLAGAAEAGELKLRVTGKYQSFDLTIPASYLEGIAKVGALAAAMQ